MPGIVEIIALLLSLAGFGLSSNPKAPTADQALEYAMPDADIVVHFDAASVIPGNYKVLTSLADQPQIKASPELQKIVRKAVNEIEGARGLAKSTTGIDFTTDVNDGTLFVQVPAQGDPRVVASVHGKFSTTTIDKIAGMTKKPVQKVGGGAMVQPDREVAVGVTKSGVLIVGSTQLVQDRLADAWKAPARAANTTLAYAAEAIAQKPIYAMIVSLSPDARSLVTKKFGTRPNFLTDTMGRHKLFAFSAYQNGIGWTWIDSKAAGLDQMELMSQGSIELLRAAQIAPRAFSKILIAGLDSYRGTDKRIDELLKQKASIFKLVESFTGDGQFTAKVDKDVKGLKLNVRLTGKTFSEVVPFSLVIPGAVLTLLTRGGDVSMSVDEVKPAVVTPQPTKKPAKPAGGGLTPAPKP